MEEHVQDVTSHQHSNNVRMDVGWRDLGIMQELFEERWERKAERHVELLLTKEDGTMSYLRSGRQTPIH